MKGTARSKFWWSGLDADIEKVSRDCQQCQTYSRNPAKAPLSQWEIPTRPWSRVHIDFLGPIEGVSYLVLVDAKSKWPEVFPMRTTTSEKVIEVL